MVLPNAQDTTLIKSLRADLNVVGMLIFEALVSQSDKESISICAEKENNYVWARSKRELEAALPFLYESLPGTIKVIKDVRS